MSVKDAITRKVHNVLCRTDKIPQADWGCCGCGNPEMDLFITVGCDYCKGPGEGYCWGCVADLADWPVPLTLADFTVLPGREQ